MSLAGHQWLPDSAFSTDCLAAVLSVSLRQWAERWFRSATPRVTRVRLDARRRDMPSPKAPLPIALTAGGKVSLVRAALGPRDSDTGLTARDQTSSIERFLREMLSDLHLIVEANCQGCRRMILKRR